MSTKLELPAALAAGRCAVYKLRKAVAAAGDAGDGADADAAFEARMQALAQRGDVRAMKALLAQSLNAAAEEEEGEEEDEKEGAHGEESDDRTLQEGDQGTAEAQPPTSDGSSDGSTAAAGLVLEEPQEPPTPRSRASSEAIEQRI